MVCPVSPLLKLLLIRLLIEPVHFTHLLDFVEVNYEAPLVGMVLFDAFSAEHREVV